MYTIEVYVCMYKAQPKFSEKCIFSTAEVSVSEREQEYVHVVSAHEPNTVLRLRIATTREQRVSPLRCTTPVEMHSTTTRCYNLALGRNRVCT